MPSRERQRRAKRREEYIQNRNGELETSRVRYNASKSVCCDEQNSDELRASKRQKQQETNRDSKSDEQNSDELRASKRQKQQETNRDSKRIQYWINPSAACLAKRAQYQKRKREAQR